MEETPATIEPPKQPDAPEAKPQVITAEAGTIEQTLKDAGMDIRPGDYMERMIQIAKSHNGWNFVSISMLKDFNDTPKHPNDRSALAATLRRINMFKYPKLEDFKKVFVGGPVAFVQVHKKLPALAKDGLYNSCDVLGNYFESRSVTEFLLTDEAVKNFKPFIIIKSQGTMGIMYGDPVASIETAANATAAAMAMDQQEHKE